jgi:WD40 repeat protein
MARKTIMAGLLVGVLLATGCKEEKPAAPETTLPPGTGGPLPQVVGPQKHRSAVAFSPDGKYLLLGYSTFRGKDGYRSADALPYLNLIDMANGKVLYSFLQEEDSVTVKEIEFLSDSRRAMAKLDDGVSLFLDVGARKILWRKKLGLCALAPDGSRLFSQADGGELKVWNISGETPVLVSATARKVVDGEPLRIQPQGALYDNHRILSWTATPESMRRYGDWKGVLKYFVWDLAKGEALRLELPDCSLQGRSPDGKCLLFRVDQPGPWVEKEDFRLWDAKMAKFITPTCDKWKWQVFTVGRRLEQVPGGGLWFTYVRFWDVGTGMENGKPSKEAGSGKVSPDGKWALLDKSLSKSDRLSYPTLLSVDKGEIIWSFEDQKNY